MLAFLLSLAVIPACGGQAEVSTISTFTSTPQPSQTPTLSIVPTSTQTPIPEPTETPLPAHTATPFPTSTFTPTATATKPAEVFEDVELNPTAFVEEYREVFGASTARYFLERPAVEYVVTEKGEQVTKTYERAQHGANRPVLSDAYPIEIFDHNGNVLTTTDLRIGFAVSNQEVGVDHPLRGNHNIESFKIMPDNEPVHIGYWLGRILQNGRVFAYNIETGGYENTPITNGIQEVVMIVNIDGRLSRVGNRLRLNTPAKPIGLDQIPENVPNSTLFTYTNNHEYTLIYDTSSGRLTIIYTQDRYDQSHTNTKLLSHLYQQSELYNHSPQSAGYSLQWCMNFGLMVATLPINTQNGIWNATYKRADSPTGIGGIPYIAANGQTNPTTFVDIALNRHIIKVTGFVGRSSFILVPEFNETTNDGNSNWE